MVIGSRPSARGGGWWAKRSGALSATGDDGRVGAAAPLGPRAVIDRRLRRAGQVEPERHDAGADARAAARRHLLRRVEAGRRDARAELVGGQHRAGLGIEQLVVGQVEGARHVAGAQAGPGLRNLAAKTVGRPRVDDLLALAVDQRLYVVD